MHDELIDEVVERIKFDDWAQDGFVSSNKKEMRSLINSCIISWMKKQPKKDQVMDKMSSNPIMLEWAYETARTIVALSFEYDDGDIVKGRTLKKINEQKLRVLG